MNGRKARDMYLSLLEGAVVRTPRVMHGVLEVTLAGHVRLPGGKVLPWYYRVLMAEESAAAVRAGDVFLVEGLRQQLHFGTEWRSMVMVYVW